MTILFTFPGQGAQYPHMLQDLPDLLRVTALLDEASDILHQDVRQLDSSVALKNTQAVQICLLVSAVAFATELAEYDVLPDYVCGLSIGAFPAAVVAGVISFADAVQLVEQRAILMTEAYPVGYGLAAIIGLPLRVVEKIVAQVNREHPVYVANINSENQIVIAGSEQGIKLVFAQATCKGAQKVQQLAVSVPSHCDLLTQQAEQLHQLLLSMDLQSPVCDYLSASSARVLRHSHEIGLDLAYNMACTVHWRDAMVSAQERGVTLALELPPGATLTQLCHQNAPGITAMALANTDIQSIRCRIYQQQLT